jgi:rhodanese-related sulfurtransferase
LAEFNRNRLLGALRRATRSATVAAASLAFAGTVAAQSTPPPAQSPVGIAAPADSAPIAPTVPQVSQSALLERSAAKGAEIVILDVRTPAEYAAGHVPGAINIPHDQLGARIEELAAARDKDIVVYCRTGRRSNTALHTLTAAGFARLAHLEGDYTAWQAAQRPIVKPEAAKPASAVPSAEDGSGVKSPPRP